MLLGVYGTCKENQAPISYLIGFNITCCLLSAPGLAVVALPHPPEYEQSYRLIAKDGIFFLTAFQALDNLVKEFPSLSLRAWELGYSGVLRYLFFSEGRI
jgi:hypothetical protein